jgi:hypothetical protein
MKGIITALGIVSFAATMAVAKNGKFQNPTDTGTRQSYAQWHRPYSTLDRGFHGPEANAGG